MEMMDALQLPEHGAQNSRLMLIIERFVIHGINGATLDNRVKGAVAEAFQYLKTLWHPNVCCYTDLLRTKDNVYLLASEGYSLTLEDVIKGYFVAQHKHSPGKDIIKLDFEGVVHQIVCGLQFLHANGIQHGALGLHNIFIHSDGTVKIGCYANHYLQSVALGASSPKLSKCNSHRSNCTYASDKHKHHAGPDLSHHLCSRMNIKGLFYQAPEVLVDMERVFSREDIFKNDVWALGICVIQVIVCLVGCESIGQENSGEKKPVKNVASLDVYDSVMTMPQCINAGAMLMKACNAAATMINLVNTERDPDTTLSAFGIDVISMCEQALYSDKISGSTSTSIEKRLMHVMEKLLSKEHPSMLGSHEDNEANLASISEQSDQQTLDHAVDATNCKCKGRCHDEHHGEHFTFESKAFIKMVGEIVDWCTGRKVVEDLVHFTGINLDEGEIDINRESQPSVAVVYYLLEIAHKCLIIDPKQRIRSLDLLSIVNQEYRRRILCNEFENTEPSGPVWKVISTNCGNLSGGTNYLMPMADFFSRKYQRRNINVVELDRLELSIDDIFYFWRLIGNDPLDVLEVADYLAPGKCEGYVCQRVSLEELLRYAKRADLFPMIIEHQVRPTCGYARQFAFLYQWIRMRRFEKLLYNESECKSQIMLEAQLDVPPILRKQIWSVMMGIHVPFSPPMLKIRHPLDMDDDVVKEVKKAINRYDNDMLHSERCVLLLVEATHAIRETHSLASLPSSIYIVLAPLALQYFDFSEIFMAAVRLVFDKYLMKYYVTSGSFVQDELIKFNTMLNFFDPDVAAHLRYLGAFAESFVLLWFMTLFADSASFQQIFMLWDTLFNFPRNYVKYMALVIVKSAREGILQTTTAAAAIAYISRLIDSINIPMLNYTAIHTYTVWDGLLFRKESERNKRSGRLGSAAEITPASDIMSIASETNSIPEETCNLDRITFTFNMDSYPCDRCFKLTLRQFAEILDMCIVVDLRPFESYKLGHIPNSCHIDRLFVCLEKRDEASINVLVMELLNDNQGTTKSLDANRMRKKKQLHKNLNALLRKPNEIPAQDRSRDTTILLGAGDGADLEEEMKAIQRLVFHLKVPHVCYYRINGHDWPKFFTLSQI